MRGGGRRNDWLLTRLVCAGLALCTGGAVAQSFSVGTGGLDLNMGTAVEVPRSPILTIDQDMLFRDTAYGQRIEADLREAASLLASENRRIEAELADEELALTEQRASLTLEAFRELADAFDLKVSSIRRRQDNKSRALQRRRELERQSFLKNALPILGEIVTESGAVAIIDRGSVFLTANQIDITEIAIARMDEALGDGSDQRPPSTLAPEPRPE